EAAPFFFDISGSSAGGDGGDLEQRVPLPVPPPAPLVRLGLVGGGVDLRALPVLDDPGRDLRGPELAGGGEHPVAVDEEHGGELDLGAGVGADALDLEPLPLLDPVLLPAGLHDRVHRDASWNPTMLLELGEEALLEEVAAARAGGAGLAHRLD